LQILFYLAQADSVDVGLGRNSEHRFESALQMKWTAAEFFGQQVQGETVFDMLLDVAAYRSHQRGLRVAVDCLRTAT